MTIYFIRKNMNNENRLTLENSIAIDPLINPPEVDKLVLGHETDISYRLMKMDVDGKWWWRVQSGEYLERPKPWHYFEV